jgi:hypothetical protein
VDHGGTEAPWRRRGVCQWRRRRGDPVADSAHGLETTALAEAGAQRRTCTSRVRVTVARLPRGRGGWTARQGPAAMPREVHEQRKLPRRERQSATAEEGLVAREVEHERAELDALGLGKLRRAPLQRAKAHVQLLWHIRLQDQVVEAPGRVDPRQLRRPHRKQHRNIRLQRAHPTEHKPPHLRVVAGLHHQHIHVTHEGRRGRHRRRLAHGATQVSKGFRCLRGRRCADDGDPHPRHDTSVALTARAAV